MQRKYTFRNNFNLVIYTIRSLLGIISCTVLLSACSYTRFVDKTYDPILLSLPQKSDYPIARKFTYKYYDGQQVDENPKYLMLIADGVIINSPEQANNLNMYYSQPVSSGIKMSDVYQQRAYSAKRQGKSSEAAMYTEMSYSSAQQEMAFERSMAGTQLALASINALVATGKVLVDKWTTETGESVARYVREVTGAVGESAPENTTLELVINRFYRYGGDQDYAVAGNMKFTATATLKDKKGKIWRSHANYRIHLKKGTFTASNIPADMAGLLFLDDQNLPVHTGHDYTAARKSYDDIANHVDTLLWTRELSMVSHAAIRGLYKQLEFVKNKSVYK